MNKASRTSVFVAVGLLTLVLGGLVGAWAMEPGGASMDERLEKACHREVEKRTPLGHRDLETLRFRQEGGVIGVASGQVKTRVTSSHFSTVNWICRVNSRNGEILRVEFSRSSGGGKMMAATASFQ